MKNKVSGYVYIISAVKTDYFKIGVTEGLVTRRLRELQTACPFKLRYVFHCYVEDIFQTERELHKTFSSSRCIGEWFSLSMEDVQRCITLMRLVQVEEVEELEEELPIVEESPKYVDLTPYIEFEKEVLYTNSNLTKKAAKTLISNLRNDLKLNQSKIIWTLWKATPGESQAYKKALEQYKELTKEESNHD